MKRLVITLLAFISFPSIVNANLDPKIAEMCMKAADFKGCVESMSGEATNILSTNSKLNEAINDLNSKDPAGALSKVNLFLKENKESKEGYLLRALINEWDFANMNGALSDLNKAIELDEKFAVAYALRGQHLYWELSNKPAAEKDFEKALKISPENSLINYLYAEYLYDFASAQYEKENYFQAFTIGNEAKTYFEKVLANDNSNPDYLLRRIFPFGITYDTYAQLGDLNFDGYFVLKELKERKKAKEYLNAAIISYSNSIQIAPPQEETDKVELDLNYDMWDLGELYLSRGNAYSWIDNTGRKACKDWKVSKSYGNKEARKNVREWKC